MPTNQVWISGAAAVAQVGTIQITGYDATTTYKVTIGGVVVSVLGTTDADGTATALKNALAASTHPYFTAITWTVATDTITGTAVVAGVPFIAASSVSGGTGTIGSYAAVTAFSGPNDFNTAANWASGSVPASGDRIVLTGSRSVLWGLDQSGSTFTEVRIDDSYTGLVGLYSTVFQTSETAQDATASEYRDTYLKCGATLCNIGLKVGSASVGGSGRIKLNFGTVQTLTAVYSSGTSADGNGLEPIRLLGTHASNELAVVGGTVGTATEKPQSEVSTWATVSAGGTTSSTLSNSTSGALVNLGSGCTLTTINVGGASVVNLGANCTTVTVNGGAYTAYKTATHTTVNCFSGTVNYLSNGTVTNLNAAGIVNFTGDVRAKTVTNATLYKGATINADTGRPKSVTFTNGWILSGCGDSDVTINYGTNYTLTPS